MKKLYLKPMVKAHQTRVRNVILAGSGGEVKSEPANESYDTSNSLDGESIWN